MSGAHGLLFAIVAASIALMLLRPRGLAEAWWVGGGALLLLALGLVPAGLALRAVAQGADVYFFLIGMMLLSLLASALGVFDWVACLAVRAARGSRARLFTLVYALGTLVTICLSNDATAVVLTPAVLVAVRRARVEEPRPYLFACALIANAASFVLPISNPANLVVFQGGLPTLWRWLLAFALPSLLSIGATYAVLRLLFRAQLRGPIDARADDARLTPDGRWVLAGLLLVVAVLGAASALDLALGLPTLLAAALVTCVVCVRARRDPRPLLREISWSTLVLVAALFVLVAAVESAGALAWTARWLGAAAALPAAAGALATAGVVGLLNNVVNNLPLGLLAGATLRAAHPAPLLTQAILIGVDLGPNLSVTGSLATLLWLLALRKERVPVGFLDFLRVGAIAMPAALLAAMAGALWVRALGGL